MIKETKSTIMTTSDSSGISSSVTKCRQAASGISRNGRTAKVAGSTKTNKASVVSRTFLATGALVATLSTGIGVTILSSAVHADNTDVVDEINITVPSSCSMTGTGMNSHNDDIANGIYKENIGTTTLKAFCNDNAGFAIYATGFTGDEIGGENSNKLVGTTTGTGNIISGIATGPDGSNDISNWAMKLTKLTDSGDTTGTNAFTIDSAPNTDGGEAASFTNYHVVPNEYTKVAHKDTSTSMDETIGGVSLTTTYAAYISKTQPAGTYSGKVKYTLVHPASGLAPGEGIVVTYNGNGLTFPNGDTTNTVTYTEDCTNVTYIAITPEIVKSSNVNDDGTKSTSYTSDVNELIPFTASGASKLRVVIRYAVSNGTGLAIATGNWDGQGMPDVIISQDGNASGTNTYEFNGDTITFNLSNFSGSTPVTDYDYGFWAQVYPIYDSEPAGIETNAICPYTAGRGTYMIPNHVKGTWTVGTETLADEDAVKEYISNHKDEVATSGLTVTAANPYAIVYDGNGANNGSMNGYVTIPDPANPDTATGVNNTVDLMAPNYKKDGYGFAGWSENQNATVNTDNTTNPIYGPNQNINAGTLTYDEDDNKSAVLYAVWVPTSGNMQDFSCSTLNTNQITALTDTRDNNVYTVGKLADGNCWMMENLRLADTDENNNPITLNSTNTNNPASTFTALAASSDEWCTEDDSEACVNQNKLNTNNSKFSGTNSQNIQLIPAPGQYNGSNSNGDSKGADGNNYSWYGYGNYYNWYTATAGTGTYSQTSGNATGDICPHGWTLPSGYQSSSNEGQFSALDSAIGGTGSDQYNTPEASNRWRTYPNNFLYSGEWYGSVAYGRGVSGHYWSRTANGSSRAYGSGFYSEWFQPGTGDYGKEIGNTVRCLAQ